MDFFARKDQAGNRQSLKNHLFGAARLSEKFGKPARLSQVCKIAALLHDCGKYKFNFQKKLDGAEIFVDHSTSGGKYIESRCGGFHRLLIEALQLVILSHHGGLLDCIGELGSLPFYDRINKQDMSDFSDFEREIGKPDLKSAFHELDAALKMNTKTGEAKAVRISLYIKFLYSCLIDADRLDSAYAFSKDKYQTAAADFKAIAEWLDFYVNRLPLGKLSAVRNEIYGACKSAAKRERGIFRLNVATGGGKTISSFAFALAHAARHKMKRIIYVVPYLSIIEQNAESIRKILTEGGFDCDTVMECHSNVVLKRETPDGMSTFCADYMPQDNYNAPVIFTTMVQFLENVYGGGTRDIRRFHHYADSVIIFDEIQSLPLRCVCLFNALADFLAECGSSVVLCSATQPKLDLLPASASNSNCFDLRGVTDIACKEYTELKRTNLVGLFLTREGRIIPHSEEDIRRCLNRVMERAQQTR